MGSPAPRPPGPLTGRPWASGDKSLRFSPAAWGEFDLDPLTLARKAVCGVGASLAGELSATGWAGARASALHLLSRLCPSGSFSLHSLKLKPRQRNETRAQEPRPCSPREGTAPQTPAHVAGYCEWGRCLNCGDFFFFLRNRWGQLPLPPRPLPHHPPGNPRSASDCCIIGVQGDRPHSFGGPSSVSHRSPQIREFRSAFQ